MELPEANRPVPTSIVHRYFLLLKAHYFLFFSAFGAVYPILNITLRGRGLSTNEVSYINLIIPFLIFFTNPLLGFIADRSRRSIFTFNILLALVTILYGILFVLPTIQNEKIQGTIENELNPTLKFCVSQESKATCSRRSDCGCNYDVVCFPKYGNNDPFSLPINISENDEKLDSFTSKDACSVHYEIPLTRDVLNTSEPVEKCEISCNFKHACHGNRRENQTLVVVLYWLIFIFGTNSFSNAISLGASIGFSALPRADLFGKQRVWGTIGFGLSAFLASRLHNYFATEHVYIIMFAVLMSLCILVTSLIRTTSKKSANINNGMINEREMTDLNTRNSPTEIVEEKNIIEETSFKIIHFVPLLKQMDVLIFLSLTFIWGMSYAGLDPYLYLYVDEISPCQSHLIIGWMTLISASSEVLALFFAGRMLKYLGSNFLSVIILIAFTIRFSGYYLIREAYYILCMETMHFFNFGILYVLIAQKADALAPAGLSGTFQGVVYGISFGLGRGVGLIVSSFVYTRNESRFLFFVFSIGNGLAALIYSSYFLFRRLTTPTKPKNFKKNLNIPKIVIEPETNINEESLLSSSPTQRYES